MQKEIVLRTHGAELGFSISGGTDDPHNERYPSIYITKIIPGGAAQFDGQLVVGDIITRINDVDTTAVEHIIAVNALKSAGEEVSLKIKRVKPTSSDLVSNIELHRGDTGFGFTIAGGTDNPHIAGDDGIFVTKIIAGGAAHLDKRLKVGDKIITVNGDSLVGTTHENAVFILKTTGRHVILKVSHHTEL